MTTKNNQKVESLLEQVAAASATVLAAIENCSLEQWQTPMVDQDRTVGVVFHHIFYAYPFIADWAAMVVNDQDLPPISYDAVHGINKQHAEAAASATKADTITLLKANTQIVQEKLSGFSDADLAKKAPFDLVNGQEISAQQIVEWFLINHAQNHLGEIQKTLES